jgi:hypothetical protein
VGETGDGKKTELSCAGWVMMISEQGLEGMVNGGRREGRNE